MAALSPRNLPACFHPWESSGSSQASYIESSDRGPAKKDCATACATARNPIGIVDSKGTLYVTAGLQEHQSAQALLAGKLSEQVAATGTLVSKGGTRILFIKSVK